ncbi:MULTISPECIES: endolytic transglycosylase MltG [Actinomycetes]|uniref:Endolytic murein transglycosylase n=2 Tax=Actinomycetes TaxID=1760 RepID=A0ABP6LSJ1_9MICC
MSDDMPHQAGSRRRRREIREARERARAEEERQAAEATPSGRVPFEQAIGAAGATAGEGVSEAPRAATSGEAESVQDARVAPVSPAEDILGPEGHVLEEHVEHDADGAPLLITSSSYGRGYQTVTPLDTGTSREILTRRRERRRRRNLTLGLVFGGFAALVVIFAVVFNAVFGGLLSGPEDYETQAGDTVTFEVNPGEGWEVVGRRLAEEGIIASQEALRDALRNADDLGVLQAGEFEVREEMPAADAVSALTPDREAQGVVWINAGWRIDEVFSAVAEATGIPEADFREAAEDPADFGLPEEAETLEGYLAVGEYRFSVEEDPEPAEVLQSMVDRTFEEFEDAGITDEDEQWRAVIIASLITGEANHSEPEDYRVIASAIENRLDPDNTETGGLLQIDAAVNYGLGLSGDLHFPESERLNPENEYNTYVHEGLPPGPIAAPTPGTLEAAVDPAETDYYYWVTVNVETGETRFNETYAEHLEDVAVFNDYCEDNPGVCSPAEEEAAEAEVEEGE